MQFFVFVLLRLVLDCVRARVCVCVICVRADGGFCITFADDRVERRVARTLPICK